MIAAPDGGGSRVSAADGSLLHVSRYELLYGLCIGIDPRRVLRKIGKSFVSFGHRRFKAERLTDGIAELRRLRGLRDDHGNVLVTSLESHFHGDCRVRIDNDIILLVHVMDGREYFRFSCLPRRDIDDIPWIIFADAELPLIFQLCPETG